MLEISVIMALIPNFKICCAQFLGKHPMAKGHCLVQQVAARDLGAAETLPHLGVYKKKNLDREC